MSEIKYRREALTNKPAGYYELPKGVKIVPDDLVWSWTSHKFMRADSPEWLFSPLRFSDEIICVLRKPKMTDFELSVPVRRSYRVK